MPEPEHIETVLERVLRRVLPDYLGPTAATAPAPVPDAPVVTTLPRAAQRLGVHPRSVRRAVVSRGVQPVPGTRRLYCLHHIEAALQPTAQS